MDGRTIFRFFLVLVLLAVLAAAGIYVYNIGLSQGLAQATNQSGQAPGATPYSPYWYGPYFRPFGFGFGFLGFLFWAFLIFFLLRALFWRPLWGRRWHHGDWDRNFPERMEEWHRQMHEKSPGDQQE
jgi:hypothetical protein